MNIINAIQILSEAKSVSVYDYDDKPSARSAKDLILDKSSNMRISILYENGDISIFERDSFSEKMADIFRKRGSIMGYLDRKERTINFRKPDDSPPSYATRFNKDVEKISKWVERETGEKFKIIIGSHEKESVPIEDPYSKNEIVLYHGTTTKFLDDIKKYGLRPDMDDRVWDTTAKNASPTSKNAVYLTHLPKSAKEYAYKAVEIYGGTEVILKVIVAKDRLIPDDDYYHGLSRSERKNATWQKSLKLMGQVAYKGRIPASKIEIEEISERKYNHKSKSEKVENFKEYSKVARIVKNTITIFEDVYENNSKKFKTYEDFSQMIEYADSYDESLKIAKKLLETITWNMVDFRSVRDMANALIKDLESLMSFVDKYQKIEKLHDGFSGKPWKIADDIVYSLENSWKEDGNEEKEALLTKIVEKSESIIKKKYETFFSEFGSLFSKVLDGIYEYENKVDKWTDLKIPFIRTHDPEPIKKTHKIIKDHVELLDAIISLDDFISERMHRETD
jgi:hypothetical protein